MELRLTAAASNILPKTYSDVTCAVLEFIEEKLGRNAIETALWRRQAKVLETYRKRIQANSFDQKVEVLAKLRDSEGYMAQAKKKTRAGNYDLLVLTQII